MSHYGPSRELDVEVCRTSRHVPAVDLGTSGARVALIGFDRRVVVWEAEPVELIVLPGGGVEQ